MSKDLQNELTNGKFKQDLYYRINVVPLKIPSLSERKEDIEILCNYFMKYLGSYTGLAAKQFSEEALVAMKSYTWPGNVRQLKNLVEWLLIMHRGENIIRANMLPPEITSNSVQLSKSEENANLMSMTLREAREIFEKQYLCAQMNRFNGNISKTSAFVGMERSALHRKLKSLNIHTNSGPEEVEETEEV